MSSRALRKLQREREEQEQARALQAEASESDDDVSPAKTRPVLNAFQMLNEDLEDDDTHSDATDEIDDQHETSNVDVSKSSKAQAQSTATKTRPKKKKKKGKGKAAEKRQPEKNTDRENGSELDEIDQALHSLAVKNHGKGQDRIEASIDEVNAQLYRLLAVEAKHLIAINEMKRLFGNIVLESNEDDAAPARRRGRGPQNLDLGTALTARHSLVSKGQGLKGLALRRNPLMMGKEEWPQATSGGLGMEMVEKMEDGTIEFRFTHSALFQGLQREFEACVASMDPQRLITMLMFNPYHISTLLQVSEIAKQQGDHSVAGDLVERALFSFGRSVHSTFANALSQGKARLDFRRPENREFWLASWRYIKDLGQRGTWRTAFEWAKLVLSLDPEGDPYCITKIIDQLAIRGGQSEHFIKLAEHSFFRSDVWKNQPNIHISKALAQYRLKQAQECRQTLTKSVHDYPWIFARLYQELSLSNLPKVIWGKQPRTDRERFDMESYVLNAKDIWSLPDSVSLLVEVCETAEPLNNPLHEMLPPNDRPIDLDEARSTLLTNVPALINLLPRDLTTLPSRSSDPLPPPDDLLSYDPELSAPSSNDPILEAAYADLPPDIDVAVSTGANTITTLLHRMLPFLQRTQNQEPLAEDDDEDLQQRIVRQRTILRAMVEQLESTPDEAPLGAPRLTHHDVDAEREILEHLYREAGILDGSNPESQQPTSQLQPLEPLESELNDENHGHAANPPGWLPQDSDEERERRLGIPRPGTPPANPNEDSEEGDRAELESGWPSRLPNSPLASEAQPSEQEAQSRIQHWLAGQGVQGLKAYLEANPLPARKDQWENKQGRGLLLEYATKLRELRNTRTRDFLLKYALPQGTSKEVQRLVEDVL